MKVPPRRGLQQSISGNATKVPARWALSKQPGQHHPLHILTVWLPGNMGEQVSSLSSVCISVVWESDADGIGKAVVAAAVVVSYIF